MAEYQREQLVRVNEAPLFVDRSHAIGIAVVDEAAASARFHHRLLAIIDPRLDRFGTHVLHILIGYAMDLVNFNPQRTEHGGQIAARRTVHRVIHNMKMGVRNRVAVNERHQCIKVRRGKVHDVDGTAQVCRLGAHRTLDLRDEFR